MIIVVADDFTGAAELAGIGLSHGLTVELDIERLETSTEAEMLVIATDTRSKSLEAALNELRDLAERISFYSSVLVYKKVDSVLRGHILEEIEVMVEVLGMKGAILVPANPLLGRVIINGHYYVKGEPLQHTSFSQDPEFGISTSSVAGLLAKNGSSPKFSIVKPEEFSGEGNIVLGEASCNEDLDFWAEKAISGWLPAGAAGFFHSLLHRTGRKVKAKRDGKSLEDRKGILYVCGSTFQGSREQVRLASESGPFVCFMPGELFREGPKAQASLGQWINEVVSTLDSQGKAVVAVREDITSESGKSKWIRKQFSLLAEGVLGRSEIRELVIEGGSTASAILYRLGFTRLKPFHQFEQGVIQMKIEDKPGMNLTLKPGSYAWPESVWKFQLSTNPNS